MTGSMTTPHRIAPSQDAWLAARRDLLAAEKELTRLRDRVAEQRRGMPWLRVEKPYVFETPDGPKTLAALFDGRGQLLVYHFMFGPDWEAGCKSCSFWVDGFAGVVPHLAHRDVTLAVVSRGPLAKLLAYAARMGWVVPWVSSLGSDFSFDFGVSFTTEQRAGRPYNYGTNGAPASEMPGVSVFIRDGDAVFHPYSCYARGLDALQPAYQLLDLVPKGRDEADGPMRWLRRRDEYDV